MKILFVLPILLSLLIPYQLPSSDACSPLALVNFERSRSRRAVEKPEVEGNAPARAMIPRNRNFAGNAVANKAENPVKESVVIKGKEYADGSIRQKKDWNLNEVKASYDRMLREQWAPGMCKGL